MSTSAISSSAPLRWFSMATTNWVLHCCPLLDEEAGGGIAYAFYLMLYQFDMAGFCRSFMHFIFKLTSLIYPSESQNKTN
jgi:hypothetical protein